MIGSIILTVLLILTVGFGSVFFTLLLMYNAHVKNATLIDKDICMDRYVWLLEDIAGYKKLFGHIYVVVVSLLISTSFIVIVS